MGHSIGPQLNIYYGIWRACETKKLRSGKKQVLIWKVDLDYANRADAWSVGGYIGMLGGGCVAWSSKKQRTMSLSTTEAEYLALTEGEKQLVWLWQLLGDLTTDQMKPTSIWSDNLGVITLSNDTSYHACTKHINITYHFICERVASNEATLTYIQSKENPTDLMTKSLDPSQHQYLCAKIGFINDSEVRGSVGISDTSECWSIP